MLNTELFNKILMEPAQRPEINRLRIVSGFATAGLADRHLKKLSELQRPISVELMVGMTSYSGIQEAQHLALKTLVQSPPDNINFACRYVEQGPPVHAKAFCWFSEERPISAFIGSANYTQMGFSTQQVEAMTKTDAGLVSNFQNDIFARTVSCLESGISSRISLIQTSIVPVNDQNSVNLSLLVRKTGETPDRSGINWGQREGRQRNQAYINIPAKVNRQGFFPDIGERFTVITDDNRSFVMVRAQDGGKGLETTYNNSEIGEYLRARLNLNSGEYVTRQHLNAYGRTDVTFTKIDDETYFMDFSKN